MKEKIFKELVKDYIENEINNIKSDIDIEENNYIVDGLYKDLAYLQTLNDTDINNIANDVYNDEDIDNAINESIHYFLYHYIKNT